MRKRKRSPYLDLDKLFDTFSDRNMLISTRRLRDDRLVARPHPATLPILIRQKRLLVRLLVIQIPQHDTVTLRHELARLPILRHFTPIRPQQLDRAARDQAARGAEHDVGIDGRAHHRARLGEPVALPDQPARIQSTEVFGRFAAERRGAREDCAHRGEVVFGADALRIDHGDDDGRDEVQGVDLVLLDGVEVGLHLELREDDDLVAPVCGAQVDND